MDLIAHLFNTLLTYPIFNALMVLYHLLGDIGLSIVALTATVFLITFPFTWKHLQTARATQALQPELAELKGKHAKNPLARAEAERAFYKDHGISPFSSFGPLLLQSAVLSGLFFALNSVLRNSTLNAINQIMYPFLVHFSTLPDLNLTWFTVFNAFWHISLGYPDPTHLLPLLTGLITFMQMRMAQPITETAQGMQFFMPLISVGITLFFAWQFAAGVALYRLLWLLLSMIQRFFVTGWGSLWVMPVFAPNGSANTSRNRQYLSQQQTPPPGSTKRRGRHGGGSSARRRGQKPKRGK